ncbi:zinc-dependent alcohol dehydrogenase [Aquibacillus albus]|uniref:Threonine dehydrogenase-like Zn-dependent dehydrogenase n=1 Tax=Aquibacillus albus TaxID=1168171 RepID=A0ABS2MW00_9BACI|nr:medium chain dehydrogenase/reductase family protein [Aquibacillus albus]MBM7569963.1 threonine dehydrogenase-like Zn-dependent dehydrogenase [Aquibacillus albus]
MKSLTVDSKGVLSIKEFPIPEFNEYQALVKMESCGVCRGTDLKLIHGEFKGFDTYPAILGHEGVGRVVETGENVKYLKAGDLVLLPFLEQEVDGYTPGWGAYSEYAVVSDGKAMMEDGFGPETDRFSEAYYAQQVLPDDIDPVGAAMIVTFREVLSACKRFGFKENNSLVIYGAGPVGLSFIKFAKLLGLGPIIVSVRSDLKVQEALDFGADYAFNNQKVDVVSEVRKICKDGVDFALDAVGVNKLINESMEMVKDNGKICCYGISPQLSMDLDWSKAPYNWDLQFLQFPSKLEESEAHHQIINWIQMGVLDLNEFITEVVDFENILDAFHRIEHASGIKKYIVKF